MVQSYKRKSGEWAAIRPAGDRDGSIDSAFALAMAAPRPPRADIQGTPGHDTMDGTAGDDHLEGLGGDDILNGLGGNDLLEGGEGLDELNGGAGNDVMHGGAGIDFLLDEFEISGSDQLYGGDGNDFLSVEHWGADPADVSLLDGGNDNDIIIYTADFAGQVTVLGGAGSDRITVQGSGTASIDAGSGDDRVSIINGATAYTITLGTGVDTLTFGYRTAPPPNALVTDFAVGDAGDRLELLSYFDGALIGWDGASNPFATGHARLVQSGADTLLQVDRDAAGSANGFESLATLQNVTASALTAINLDGLPSDGSAPVGQTFVGTAGNNTLTGTLGSDLIQGLGGNDTLRGRAGDDTIEGGANNDTMNGEQGNDTLSGGSGDDSASGGLGNDILHGGDDNDQLTDLDGGNDQLYGGAGFDWIIVSRGGAVPADTILIDAGTGASIISFSGDFDHIVDILGGDDSDQISVTGGGTVTVDASTGDDSLVFDYVAAGRAHAVTLGGGTDELRVAISAPGQGVGTITVADFASGAAGDRLQVSSLFLPYRLVQDGADTVLEVDLGNGSGNWTDFVILKNLQSSTLVQHSDGYFWAPGTTGDTPPTAGDDTIPAIEGTLISGGALFANDSDPDGPPLSIVAVNGVAANVGQFFQLPSGAMLRVTSNGGWDYQENGAFAATPDNIFSGASNLYSYDSFTYTLAGGVTATVTVQVSGVDSNGDRLIGTAGADTLNGGAGNDRMEGGFGDDLYHVNSSADQVIELAGQGYDRVITSVDFGLEGTRAEQLETANAAGTSPLALGGNAFNNVIYGNAGDNILYGKAGFDQLFGGGGNDYYYVSDAGDFIVELDGGGSDRILTSVDYGLNDNAYVEVLSTDSNAGTTALALGGNNLNNIIIGNDGNNILYGKGGFDTIYGRAGNDVYYVSDAGDFIVELAGEGEDRIFASVDYTLYDGGHVEVLSTEAISGTGAITLGGNNLANTIIGNNGVNTLYGKGGNDTLAGQGGADTFLFTTYGAGDVDLITDFAVGSDKIAFYSSVFTGLTPGSLPASAFVNGTAAADTSDRILYDSATGALFYDADGTGAMAAVQFATVTAGTSLSASDFIVF